MAQSLSWGSALPSVVAEFRSDRALPCAAFRARNPAVSLLFLRDLRFAFVGADVPRRPAQLRLERRAVNPSERGETDSQSARRRFAAPRSNPLTRSALPGS